MAVVASSRRSSRIAAMMKKRSHSSAQLQIPASPMTATRRRPNNRSDSRMGPTTTPARLSQKKKKPKTTSTTSNAPTFQILDDDNLLRHIFSFVGDHHYRFIGGVNRSFQKVYVTLFPHKSTHLNASSLSLAKICWDDVKITFRYDYEAKNKYRSMLWESSAKYGNMDVVKYLLGLIRSVKHKRLNRSVKRYMRFSERWLEDWRYNFAWKAAEYGHMHLLQWACDQKVYVSKDDWRVCLYALGAGHVEILRWAVEKGFEWEIENIGDSVYIAIYKENLETLELIHSMGYDFDEHYDFTLLDEGTVWCDIAVAFGHFQVVQWLRNIGSDWGDNSIDCAVQFGQLEALEYMLLDGCRGYTVHSCKHAAVNGNLEALKLLRSVDCAWDDTVPAFAAARGHVHLIEWAINSGCPWSESACQYAAAYGTLETLKWLRAKGCPWDYNTTKYASTNEIYKWAKDNGCPIAAGDPRNHFNFNVHFSKYGHRLF